MKQETVEEIIAKLPEVMRPDFEALIGDDDEFIRDMAYMYLNADEEAQADIRAFHKFDGPEVVRQLHIKHEEGTPTAHDLEEML